MRLFLSPTKFGQLVIISFSIGLKENNVKTAVLVAQGLSDHFKDGAMGLIGLIITWVLTNDGMMLYILK